MCPTNNLCSKKYPEVHIDITNFFGDYSSKKNKKMWNCYREQNYIIRR